MTHKLTPATAALLLLSLLESKRSFETKRNVYQE